MRSIRVMVSWMLEDAAPHSLGDSLIAVRAGWMGKDCAALYLECPLRPDPHPAAKEAITFFSRLQYAATQPQSPSEAPSSPSSTLTERVDNQAGSPFKQSSHPTLSSYSSDTPYKKTQQPSSYMSNTSYKQTQHFSYTSDTPYKETQHSSSSSYTPDTSYKQPQPSSYTPDAPYKETHSSSSSYTPDAPYKESHSSSSSYTPDTSYKQTQPSSYTPDTPYKETHSSSSSYTPDTSYKQTQPSSYAPDTPYKQGSSYSPKTPYKQASHTQDTPQNNNAQHWSLGDQYAHGVMQSSSASHTNARPHQEEHKGEEESAMMSFEAYYDRYGGKGPMALPGTQYAPKYGITENNIKKWKVEEGEEDMTEGASNQLYEKYDSPASNLTMDGVISESNSVAGMALQDPPGPTASQSWEELFKAGKYGTSVQQMGTSAGIAGPREAVSMSSPQSGHHRTSPATATHKIGIPGHHSPSKDTPSTKTSPYHTHLYTKGARPSRPSRPVFSLQPNQEALSAVKKYAYGLRRGLPAGKVTKYNTAYSTIPNTMHRPQKPWYYYTSHPMRYQHRHTTTSTTTTTTTTTPPTTTAHPLAMKDVDPFGPEDAVTDVLRNELLFEYIRDRQGSIPLDEDGRSLS